MLRFRRRLNGVVTDKGGKSVGARLGISFEMGVIGGAVESVIEEGEGRMGGCCVDEVVKQDKRGDAAKA